MLQQHHAPAVLVLTRQAVPTIDCTMYAPASGLSRGAYILADVPNGVPDVILFGTGSEVALCLEACDQLTKEGIGHGGGQHAVLGIIRLSGQELPGLCSAAASEDPSTGRSDIRFWLGASTLVQRAIISASKLLEPRRF
jgi:hypothetical protein